MSGTSIRLGKCIGRTCDFKDFNELKTELYVSDRIKGVRNKSHHDLHLLDGINAFGVAVISLEFGVTTHLTDPFAFNLNLEAHQVVHFLLTHAQSIDDIREWCAKMVIVYRKIGQPIYHWLCCDRQGNTVTIECHENGLPVVCENPVGVLTGQPSFADHLRLAQHPEVMALHPASDPDRARLQSGAVQLLDDSATGMIGLPGDMSSMSRFVKASCLTRVHSAISSSTLDEVNQMIRVLSHFFVIPELDESKCTQYMVVYSLGNGKMHFQPSTSIGWTLM